MSDEGNATYLYGIVLAPREIEYAEALGRLSGFDQFTLRVSYERDSILEEILLADPEVAELRGMIIGTSEDETRRERIRLGGIVVKTMKEWRLSDAPPILDRIEPITADVSTRDSGQPEDVLEVAVLLRRDSLDEFDAIVEDLAQTNRERMRFRLMGPQAPYDFVPGMQAERWESSPQSSVPRWPRSRGRCGWPTRSDKKPKHATTIPAASADSLRTWTRRETRAPSARTRPTSSNEIW